MVVNPGESRQVLHVVRMKYKKICYISVNIWYFSNKYPIWIVDIFF